LVADYEIVDPGDGKSFQMDKNFGVVSIETKTAGGETRIVDSPTKAGLVLDASLVVDGGDCTVTVTNGYESGGATTLVLGDAGDWFTLKSFEVAENTFRWRLVGSGGIAVAGTLQTGSVSLGSGGLLEITDGQIAASSGTATLTFKASNATAGAWTQSGWLPFKIGSTSYYIPYFDATHS
jgi:hypothetical protein